MSDKSENQFDRIFSSVRYLLDQDGNIVKRADGSRPIKLKVLPELSIAYSVINDWYELGVSGSGFAPIGTTISASDPILVNGAASADLSSGDVAITLTIDNTSIVVDGAALAVGVINDVQHGARGSGATHAAATNITNGFLTSAHFILLEGADSTSVSDTLAVRRSDAGLEAAFFRTAGVQARPSVGAIRGHDTETLVAWVDGSGTNMRALRKDSIDVMYVGEDVLAINIGNDPGSATPATVKTVVGTSDAVYVGSDIHHTNAANGSGPTVTYGNAGGSIAQIIFPSNYRIEGDSGNVAIRIEDGTPIGIGVFGNAAAPQSATVAALTDSTGGTANNTVASVTLTDSTGGTADTTLAAITLTDSTTGSPNTTLVNVTTLAVADPAKCNDNFADIAARLVLANNNFADIAARLAVVNDNCADMTAKINLLLAHAKVHGWMAT